MESKCIVCGNTSGLIKSTCSCNNSKEYFYCNLCYSRGFESYDELINYGLYYDRFSDTYKNKILLSTLNYKNKSIKDFDRDVETILNKKEKREQNGKNS